MGELILNGVSKSFKRKGSAVKAVDSLDLHLTKGEMLVLLGPSGCGKSTTLRCIAGLEKPTFGTISIDGATVFDSTARIDVPTNHRDIGVVFQSYALWPHLTVRKNVEYPLRARHKRDILRSNRVDEVLAMVQCSQLADRRPGQLSGGQQQRVALARALVSEPALLLLDEPLSNLDTLLRTELRAQLQAVHQRVGFTGVHVTHDQAEAFTLGDRVAVMRDGKIEQLDTPAACFNAPATSYVADFTGASNRIDLVYSDGAWRSTTGPVDWLVAEPAESSVPELQIRLRPDDLVLLPASTSGNSPELAASSNLVMLAIGTVRNVLFGGTTTEYRVLVGEDLELTVVERSITGPRFGPGALVDVRFHASQAHPYGPDGRAVDVRIGGPRVSTGAGARRPVRDPSQRAYRQADR